MSTHACSTDPCPSCNPRDYEAARTLAENEKAAAQERRYVEHGELMLDALRTLVGPIRAVYPKTAVQIERLIARVEGKP